jgi:ABC-type phosphate transport system substrate-binding protein
MNRNITIAAAVAAALSGSAAFAQAPSLSQITAVPQANTINIMGSSAIKNAVLASLENNFCGGSGNYTLITSSGNNSNFAGISCTPTSGQATNGGVYNVFIRYEGGSVTGYLPIVNGVGVKAISGPSLTTLSPVINGASTTNGADDSFTISGGSFAEVQPDLGIGDVEAAALINNNYPSAYSTAVWGPLNNSGLFSLKTKPLVDEVYALFVNENSTAFTENPLNLSLQTVQNILLHKVTNWSQVLDANGNAVVSSPLAITIVNREPGSGSRAATDILLVGDACGSASNGAGATIFNKTGAAQYFSTGDVLSAANSVPGAITYATIDNAGSKANLTLVSLNGVAPSNLAAAQGTYPFWVEANFINNAANTGADSAAINNIVTALEAQATTAALADIDVIPAISAANGSGTLNSVVHLNPVGNGVVPSGGGTATVYINPYTRQGHTCGFPLDSATVVP